MELEKKIECVLFYRGEPVTKTELSRFFAVELDVLEEALQNLEKSLEERGIRLLRTDSEAALVTNPECAEDLEKMRRDEMSRDIGKAGAETLAIILYRGPISRPEIDFIRGVNSSFILRNLLVRGLIERTPSKKDQRTFTYHTTPQLLEHLGITSKQQLPDYEKIMADLDRFEKENSEETTTV